MKKQKKIRKKELESVRRTMETEGFEVTDQHNDLVLKQLNGEITEEEFLRRVREHIKRDT
ncbi:hypothetical protein ACT7CO_01490 [Bacillus pacificus]